jgi:predicted enzyme related to lactoylglutathione lyase
MTARIDGIGGVFLKANDPKALADWYAKHFGLTFQEWEPGKNYGLELPARADDDPERRISTIFSIQNAKVKLGEGRHEVALNWRVKDLAKLVATLRAEGVVIDKTEESEYGNFAWTNDPEGNRIELYQPALVNEPELGSWGG